ncbi:MAG: hypothetical protein KJ066_09135 [Acidobacteria bacterium]|nr:hypothetical protein [Acidobacteriota bacterium]
MAADDRTTSLAHDLVERLSRELADGLERLEHEWQARAASAQATAVEEATASVRADAERLVAEAVAHAREAWQASANEAQAVAERTLRSELEARLAVAEGQAAEAVAALAAAETVARAGERESKLAELSRLLVAIERLDDSRSLRETLDSLADGLTAETGRAMVWLVRDERLRAWRFHGFADAPDLAVPVSVALDEAGPLADVVRSRRPAHVRPDVFGDSTSEALRFARHPHGQAGLALPVVVGHDTVAVVYADDGGRSDRPVPDVWPEAAEILVRHASRCLEALTVARSASLGVLREGATAQALPVSTVAEHPAFASFNRASETTDVDASEPARRFARLVLSELKLEHETDVKVGRLNRDLRSRLREPIAAARRRYDDRVPSDLPARDRYFEEELVRTLADGNPAMLGAADPV